jgi:ADP-ribose diphosphatase
MEIQFSNGQQRDYERLKRTNPHGAVLIVPLLNDETVLLIKEYSAGVHRYEIGLPKGKVDSGETPLDAANRELKEEVGFGANKLHYLTTLSLAPAYLEHTIDVVIARDLYPERLNGDEPEEMEVIPWKLSDIHSLIATGECTEARSIAALYLCHDYLRSL